MNNENRFPIQVFHPHIQNIISDIESIYQTNPDVISSHLLTTIGYPLNNEYQVKLTENRIIRPNLWLLHFGSSGSGKSPLMSMITKSIDTKSNELNQHIKEHQTNMMDYLVENSSSEPVNYCLSVSQFTPEGMNRVLELNDGRSVLLKSDEISGTFKSFNQYSKGQGEEDFLKNFNYNSETIVRSDRKNNVFIRERNVSVIGCTQPEKVYEIITKDRISNGNVFRWLFVFDENDYSTRNSFRNLKGVKNNFDPMIEFNQMMKHFLTYYEKPINRTELLFSDDCIDYSGDWIDEIKKEFSGEIDKETLTNIMGKMEDYLIKVSIVLNRTRQYFDNNLPDINISVQDVINSGLIVKYFIKNTIKVLNKVSDSSNQYFKTELEKQFFDSLPDTFQGSDFISLSISKLNISIKTGQRLLKKWVSKDVHLVGKNRHNEYYKICL